MSKYDETYFFRHATVKDIDAIMCFLKNEWGEKHILANDKELFIWQYGNEQYGDKETINFLLMENQEGEIIGLNGFIPYSPESTTRYISSSITKVGSKNKIPMAGIELIKKFKELVIAGEEFSSGTNPKTMIPIAKRVLRYNTGIMKQYYMLNPEIKDFKIAKILDKKEQNVWRVTEGELKLVKVDNFDSDSYKFGEKYARQSVKSKEYLVYRYCKHPIYKYNIYRLCDCDERIKGFLIGREIWVEERKVLRLVDYIGELNYLGEIGGSLQKLLIKEKYEYIDLVVSELEEKIVQKSGLRERDENIIIPMYFEPFVQENVEVWYQRSDENITIFKADGDQDRPNFRL